MKKKYVYMLTIAGRELAYMSAEELLGCLETREGKYCAMIEHGFKMQINAPNMPDLLCLLEESKGIVRLDQPGWFIEKFERA